MSRQKSGYLRDLGDKVTERRAAAPLARRDERRGSDRSARPRSRGIGRWSAEMFLMFRLRRPDVLPVGDLGIVNAVQRVYRLAEEADRRSASARSAKPGVRIARWRRWYLWRSLDNDPDQRPRRQAERNEMNEDSCRRAVLDRRVRCLLAARARRQQRRRARSGTSPPISARRRSSPSTRPKARG